MKRSVAIGLVLWAMGVTTAQACRVNAAPQVRVMADFDAVAIGIIERPLRDLNDRSERQGWSATVHVTELVAGRADATRFAIRRSGDSAACDDGQAIPRAGERWVVYLSRQSPSGPMIAHESYPLTMARRIDARFRN